MLRRISVLAASAVVALSLALASSAYAGEDDTTTQPAPPPPPPTQTQPVPPPTQTQPVQPKPKPKPKPKKKHKKHRSGSNSGNTNKGGTQVQGTIQHQITVQRPTVSQFSNRESSEETQVSTVPRGGVQAGGGAMADDASQTALLGLGAGLILLATAGGGLALRRRGVEA